MNIEIVVISFLGLILSFYASIVEWKSSRKKNYRAVCDINDRASCTKAFSSKYGKTFGVSNSVYGIVFYFLIILLTYLGYLNYVFYLSIISFVGTIYLASILYFKVKTFCVVCTSIYVVNILLLVFSYLAQGL